MLVSVSDTDGVGARAMLGRLASMGNAVRFMPPGVNSQVWHAAVAAACGKGRAVVYVEGRSEAMPGAYRLFVLCSIKSTLDQWGVAFDMMRRGKRVTVV